MADSNSSETNLVIITRTARLKIFCSLYWKTLIIIITPILLMPVALITANNMAYKYFYVFLVTTVYWTADVLHPAIIAMMPIAIASLVGTPPSKSFLGEMYLRSDLHDCIAVMILRVAVEKSNIHKRIALKVLLVFGYSHYRLSFMLFFTTMLLSMWFSNILVCGMMMALLKSILTELEMMGILEIYLSIGKSRQTSKRHEQNVPRPSEYTIFYFLGIAYSSSIGNMTTIIGSHANQIFRIYCKTIFPAAPNIEFPHFMLLNLPGVIVMETLLYIWMNFYFLGMFRSQAAIEVGTTEEETLYMNTLLETQYQQLGKIKFYEYMVAIIVLLAAFLQPIFNFTSIEHYSSVPMHDHIHVTSPCLICAILLFIIPKNIDVIKFFKRHSGNSNPLPFSQSKSCLNWDLVKREINWSVAFISAGGAFLFESLRHSEMTTEFEGYMLYFKSWPSTAMIFIIILCCKILTEFAPDSSVVYVLIPSIAKISIFCAINPHYLMLAATLISSLSFHMVAGAPVNAMVCAYVHIPPWRMMYAGVGSTVIAIVVIWCTVAVWSTAIWTDINIYPEWADMNIFKISNKHP